MNTFDRFCTKISGWVSHAWFFIACVLLLVLWLPSIVFLSVDTWQLLINTATTCITFLLVALLTNDQKQFENATNAKLDTVLKGLSEIQDTNSEMLVSMMGAEKRIGAQDDG